VNLDAALERKIAGLRGNPVADLVMYGASWFGDDGKGWIAAAALRSAQQPEPVRRFARQMTWLTIESIAVNGPMKRVVRRPRPILGDHHPHRLRRPKDTSFPSGHSASAATMAMLLSEDGLAPLWWSIALAVGVSRVYVGVHHPSDVAAGLAVGAAFGLLARRVEVPWAPRVVATPPAS
jgi:membrane-associated phospholipid phosphatase